MAQETDKLNVLDNVLGITDVVETTTSTVTLPEVKVPKEVDNDYEYQRRNFYQLVERGQDAIDGILELAKEGEHPRAYEVALNGIRQVADVTDKTGQWSMPVLAGLASPRPVRLLDRPEPVKVVAMMPDHPPAMIRWRHYNWTVLRATGPERIGPRWWDPKRTDRLSRDYYRVEVEDGRRLWLCREGLVERGDEVSWFIYGLFS